MKFLGMVACSLLVASTALGGGIDEVNEWRRRSGLPPFIEDPAMTRFAEEKAAYRARYNLQNGHQGPKPPAGWHEGTGEATADWGWLTCESESDFRYAGAAVCLGRDGTRFMVLVCRGGSGRALLPRNRTPVHNTSYLTPNPTTVFSSSTVGQATFHQGAVQNVRNGTVHYGTVRQGNAGGTVVRQAVTR